MDVSGGAGDGAEAYLAALRQRAVLATDLSFTLSDPRRPDNPLIWVNPAFTRTTGYTAAEVLGRNCRFLQGPTTDQSAVAELRAAVAERRAATVTLVNHRKDGTPFWNQVSVNPVHDDDGGLVCFVGLQVDVSAQVRADRERGEAFAAEQAARLAAERARRQLAYLSEVTSQLTSTLDLAEGLERLADLAVPRVADWAVVNLVDDELPDHARIVIRHRHGHHTLLDRYVELVSDGILRGSLTERLRAGEPPLVLPRASVDDLRGAANTELLDIVERLGVGSLMAVPLTARRRRILGILVLVAEPGGRTYDDETLAVAVEVGRRAGVILDNLRLYTQEREAAEILQRSLLPVVPRIEGVSVATRYLPANSMAQVGGDFYEILEYEEGAIGVAVGDVVGHDLHAASAMGHLRGLLRACAWDDSAARAVPSPARVITRVDRLMQELRAAPLATMVYARLVPAGEGWRLHAANAGHPAMLLRRPDGTVEVLEEGRGLLLGVDDVPRRDLVVDLPAGSTLVAFTDGLIEQRGVDLSDGMDRIAGILAGAVPDDLDELVDQLVGTLSDHREDDVAVVAVRLDAPHGVQEGRVREGRVREGREGRVPEGRVPEVATGHRSA